MGFGTGLVASARFKNALKAGNEQRHAGDWASARQSFGMAVQIEPNSAEAWRMLGQVCRQSGDLPSAISALRQVARLQPGNVDTLIEYADLLDANADHHAAAAVYRQAMAVDPLDQRSADALHAKGCSSDVYFARLGPGIAVRAQVEPLLQDIAQMRTEIHDIAAHIVDMVAEGRTTQEVLGQSLIKLTTSVVDTGRLDALSKRIELLEPLATSVFDLEDGVRSARDASLSSYSDIVKIREETVPSILDNVAAITHRADHLEGTVNNLAGQISRGLDHLSSLRAHAIDLAGQRLALHTVKSEVRDAIEQLKNQVDAANKALSVVVTQRKFDEFQQQLELDYASLAGRMRDCFEQLSSVKGLNQDLSGALKVAHSRIAENGVNAVASIVALEKRNEEAIAAIEVQMKLRPVGDAITAQIVAATAELASRQEVKHLDASITSLMSNFLPRDAVRTSGLVPPKAGIGADAKSDAVWQNVITMVQMENEQLRTQVADQNAKFDEMLGYLNGRVEFVRREVLYEFHYGSRRGSEFASATKAEPRIVSSSKIVPGMRLNLGCGHIPREGFVNVDRRALPGVDIVSEADAIPLDAGSVAEISSAHLLEHFPQEEFVRRVLPHWRRLLQRGGRLHVIVPDGEAMIAQYSKGDYEFSDFREVLFGAQDYIGDFHFNMFTPDALTKLLMDNGFENVSILDRARKNGRCFEFELEAIVS